MSRNLEEPRRIAFAELVALLERIFVRFGTSVPNARILATNCAQCERDGSLSHGVFRIAGYVASLNSRWVDGRAVAAIEQHGPSFIRVDARNGFAQPALAAAMPLICESVARAGVTMVAIRDSHHFSALWPDLEPFADAGLVSLAMVSGLACVAPPGGRKPIFGTNPLAFATPVAGSRPLIFDFATSAMSNGDLRLAAKAKHTEPLGTGIDADGALSGDPDAILSGGALLPFGGHKGASISLMVEILASALTGGQFSNEVDFSAHAGAETPKTGQTIIVIDPTRGETRAFAERVKTLLDCVRDAGQARLPSDRRYQTRAQSERNGIPLTMRQYDELVALAQ